ncbi:unnamed protein product [Lymnaea stagnalis]|uniref:Chitin-binding type-2 domain-containing protein n=1 Tax=Lymnaea stagnalis TaxID=6523 RepID=A0AAV2H746_LYMST
MPGLSYLLLAAFIASLTYQEVHGQIECYGHQVKVNSAESCPVVYNVCERNRWAEAMCVGTFFNRTSGRCEPFNNRCPGDEFKERMFTGRKKRSVTPVDCSRSYDCPKSLTNFVFPDWENRNCDSYVYCSAGVLMISSCKIDGYLYYNPRRSSCENVTSTFNTCLMRGGTDLTPLFL